MEDLPEITEDQRDAGLELARDWLARHGGAVGMDLGEPLEEGHCEECRALAGARWKVGAFVLCLRCIMRRRRAAVKAAAPREGRLTEKEWETLLAKVAASPGLSQAAA